jgi:CheY-like chemotaxis protein
VSGAPAQSRLLVVVVDDALPVRLLTARMLRDAGYDVLSAHDGIAAVTLIQGLGVQPDLVITDLRMPAMSGQALGHWLQAEYRHLPVLYMSGFVPPDTGELPGFFLNKPFTTDTLLSLVRQAIGRTEGSARLILG